MGNKSGFVFFLFVPFLSVCCNPVLYPEGLAYVEVNQNLEYLCVHSTIAASSTVLVNWIEDGIIKGTVDFGCNNILNIVNSTLYSFACPSITNYTWTILNVQNDRNGTSWKCEIAVNNPTYQQSNEGTIYVTVPIASVEINDSATVNITDDRQYTFVSITSNGRPESDVKWFLDPRTPNDDSDDILIQEALSSFDFNNEVTFSNFRMIGNQTYNDWQIYCAANNTASMSPVTSNRVTIKILEILSSTTSRNTESSEGTTTTTTTSIPTTTTPVPTPTSTSTITTAAGNTNNSSSSDGPTTTTITDTVSPNIDKSSDESEIVLIAVCSSIGGVFVVTIVVCVLWYWIRNVKSSYTEDRSHKRRAKQTSLHHLQSPNNQQMEKKPSRKTQRDSNEKKKNHYFSHTLGNKKNAFHQRPGYNDEYYQMYHENEWQRSRLYHQNFYNSVLHKEQMHDDVGNIPRDTKRYVTSLKINPVYTESSYNLSEYGNRQRYMPDQSAYRQQKNTRPHFNRTMSYQNQYCGI